MTAAQRGARNRRHGHETERKVAAYLREQGFAEARTSRSALGSDGHRAPGDIAGVPGLCLEAKSTKSSAWPSWRAQLLAECPPGDVAVLVRRVRGVADVGQWDAEMDWLQFMELSGDCAWRGAELCQRTRISWVRVPFRTITDLLKEQA